MTVMRNLELYPNGDPIANKKVLFKVWSAPAYSEEGEFSLEAVGEVKTDNDGYWEAELEPSAGLLPTGNVYIAEIVFRGGVVRHLFNVPEVAPEHGAEPYWIGDHLADPPGALMTAALADHILDPNAHNETVHPDLAVHDALGLATDAALAAEAVLRANADTSLNDRLAVVEALGPLTTDVELAAAVAAEAALRTAADTALDARLDVIEALGPLATDAEIAAAVAAEAAIRNAADNELAGRIETIENLGPLATDAELANEAATRLAGDNALDTRLDAIEALGTLATNAQIVALDARIDTLEGAGYATTDTVNAAVATLTAADVALDGRLDALEGAGPYALASTVASLDARVVTLEEGGGGGGGDHADSDHSTLTTVIADLATLDSNVVKLTGNQTVGGQKRFTEHMAMGTGTVDQIWFGVPTNTLLNMRETFTGDFNASQRVAQVIEATFNPTTHGYPTGAGFTTSWAQISNAEVPAACAFDVYEVNAGLFLARHAGSAIVTMLAGVEGRAFNIGSGTVTDAYGGWFAIIAQDGIISNANIIKADRPFNAGDAVMTNLYGLLIDDMSGIGVTRSENIRSAGANSTNVFEGQIHVQNKVTVQRDIEITDATKGLVLERPDGGRVRVTVNNSNDLVTAAL